MFVFLIVHITSLYSTLAGGCECGLLANTLELPILLGINVFRTRYMSVILGGMMAGFGGAYFHSWFGRAV
jgi:general nucleoside transport system permease protein